MLQNREKLLMLQVKEWRPTLTVVAQVINQRCLEIEAQEEELVVEQPAPANQLKPKLRQHPKRFLSGKYNLCNSDKQ